MSELYRPIKWEKAPEFSEVKVGDGRAWMIYAEAEATRYALIGFPKTRWDVGYFACDGYLIVDPYNRGVYTFCDYVSDDYLREKFNGRPTKRDAVILAEMANKLIKHIEHEEDPDTKAEREAMQWRRDHVGEPDPNEEEEEGHEEDDGEEEDEAERALQKEVEESQKGLFDRE